MKKFCSLMLIVVLMIVMVGCGASQGNGTTETSNTKSAVVYFSATHNTEKVAKCIAEIQKCDVNEIVPKVAYTKEDLTYDEKCRSHKEQVDDKARPEIDNKLELSDYDTIYLGYPIWLEKAPKIILTFLDNYDLSGKTIIPFCTSGGSGIEESVKEIKSYKSNWNILDGKMFRESPSKEEVQKWLDTLK